MEQTSSVELAEDNANMILILYADIRGLEVQPFF